MKNKHLFCAASFFALPVLAPAQLIFTFSNQTIQTSASAYETSGLGQEDFDSAVNAAFGFSHVEAGASARYGGNEGSGIARQTSYVDNFRLEAVHYGDGMASASGNEGDTASGGANCDWVHGFRLPSTAPFVTWGRIGAFDSAYAFFRLYEGDGGVPLIDEERGRFLHTGELAGGMDYSVQYQSNASPSAGEFRPFRSGVFEGEVFFKINTILADELRPQMGQVLAGDIGSIAVSQDEPTLEVLAKELPWNRINLYILTPMPSRPGTTLVADVVCRTSTDTPTLWIRAFNWRTQQWVSAYTGPTSTSMARRIVTFPGAQSDYLSPVNGPYQGKVVGSLAWMGRNGTLPTWTAEVDMFQLSWR